MIGFLTPNSSDNLPKIGPLKNCNKYEKLNNCPYNFAEEPISFDTFVTNCGIHGTPIPNTKTFKNNNIKICFIEFCFSLVCFEPTSFICFFFIKLKKNFNLQMNKIVFLFILLVYILFIIQPIVSSSTTPEKYKQYHEQ